MTRPLPAAAPAGSGVMLATIVIPATPAGCLSPNRPVDPRTKARSRKALKEAAFLAARNWSVAHPGIAPFGLMPLRLHFTVCWEPGRKRWDGDNLLGALKGATDGIAQALGASDAAWEFAPVEQVVMGVGQGYVLCDLEVLS